MKFGGDEREQAREYFECRLPPQFRQLVDVRTAAEMLGVRASTVRAWLYQRRLPCIHCGRAVRIPADAIAQFIERNTIPAKEGRR